MTKPDVQVHRGAPELLVPLSEMIDAVYRPQLPAGEGMSKEFPHVFAPGNARNIYYAEEAGRPVSMVAVFPQQVILHGVTMQVASIGLVATLPAFQGRQISSAILNRVVSDLTLAQVPLMLVSGDRGLYSRIHCVPAGNMFEVGWTGSATAMQTVVPDPKLLRVMDIPKSEHSQWASRLGPIYRQETFRYRRTDEQMALLLTALWSQREGYDQRLMVFVEGEQPVGYAVVYEKRRVPGVIEVMEWAGSRGAFVGALDTIRQRYGAKIVRFHVHQTDYTMRTMLVSLGVEMRGIPLQGTIRMLDVDALFSCLNPVLKERFGASAEVLQQGDSWTVTVGDRQITTKHLEELTSWVFDLNGDNLGVEFVHTDDLNYI